MCQGEESSQEANHEITSNKYLSSAIALNAAINDSTLCHITNVFSESTTTKDATLNDNYDKKGLMARIQTIFLQRQIQASHWSKKK